MLAGCSCIVLFLILCFTNGNTAWSTLRHSRPPQMGMFWTVIQNASAPSVPSSSAFLSAASTALYRPKLIIDRASVSKVAGGTIAKNDQFPHLVAIILIFADGSDTLCGGSILADRFILTAAHCLYGMQEATIIPGQSAVQIPMIIIQ
uniref:Peptidase S1 domain-containing protein n=1 Tax=Anopheles christyi TaxID=43041 RepID=A0A182JSK6_9DIPT